MQFLMGLSESYSAIRSQILMTNPSPSVDHAYSLINEEEMQSGIATTFSNHDATAFYSITQRNKDWKT